MLRYKEIKLMLMEDISCMGPFDKLPSRLTLCKKYDTTRTTLDKAIKELEREGVVFCRDGSGTYVAAPEGYDVRRPSNWGIIVPDVTEDIYASLVRGVEDVAQSANANVILCNFDHSLEKQATYIQRLILTGIDGIILVPVLRKESQNTKQLYSTLTDIKKPVVFCNMTLDGIDAPVVTSNSFFGGYFATKHLLQKGYRHIAFLTKYRYRTSEDRCQGYLSALQENNIPIARSLIVDAEETDGELDGYHAMKQLLNSKVPLDAVFCFNDALVFGVYKAIEEMGLRVSDDIGVIGYDDSNICTALRPMVTSMSCQSLQVGKMAAELLLKQIKGQQVSTFPCYLFMPELMERDSCLGPKY